MNRKHTSVGAFAIALATTVAAAASAQNTATPNTAAKAETASTKAVDKGEKATGKLADKVEKAGDKAKSADDRAARREKEKSELRTHLTSAWKGAPSEALRQELGRHAERLARLERIKEVADGEKDKDSSDKAQKLITKENERHDKWMTRHAPSGTPSAVTPGTTPGSSPAVAPEAKKEGAR